MKTYAIGLDGREPQLTPGDLDTVRAKASVHSHRGRRVEVFEIDTETDTVTSLGATEPQYHGRYSVVLTDRTGKPAAKEEKQ